MSIFGGPSADVVISQQTWVNITAEAEKLAAMAKECAAERQALRDKNDALRARVAEAERLIRHIRNEKRPTIDRIIGWQNDADRWLAASSDPLVREPQDWHNPDDLVRIRELEADAARFVWVLPIVSGDDDAMADSRTVELGLHLSRGLTGRAAIDAARLSGNKEESRNA